MVLKVMSPVPRDDFPGVRQMMIEPVCCGASRRRGILRSAMLGVLMLALMLALALVLVAER